MITLKFELEAPIFPAIDDYTFFCRAEDLKSIFVEPSRIPAFEGRWDETVLLTNADGQQSAIGRLNLARCFAGEQVSGSFRVTGDVKSDPSDRYHHKYHISLSKYAPKSGFGQPGTQEKPANLFMNSIKDQCSVLYDCIFSKPGIPQGLILVSGATAAGKSNIARGIIFRYLEEVVSELQANERRPHLVTFEDPIDKRWANDPISAVATGIDYTPRERGKDVDSLSVAIHDALRQTPKVFFVGEVRTSKDCQELLRFAATGHLAVTTSHAGSLTEAMGQLFRAAGGTTPATRSDIASRVLAIVHLRATKLSGSPGLNMTIPTLWVRSPASTKSLMADGLSALLPYRDLPLARELGCLGRTYFAEQLLNCEGPTIRSNFEKDIRETALAWDLEGR